MNEQPPSEKPPKHLWDSKIQLPSTFELSILAANLCRIEKGAEKEEIEGNLNHAIKIALQLFLYSAEHLQPLRGISSRILYSEILPEKWIRQKAEEWDRKLVKILDLKAPDDSVREYLAQNGVIIKNARSIIESLKKYHLATTPEVYALTRHEEMLQKAQKIDSKGNTIYHIPILLLEQFVKWRKFRKSQAAKKGHQKRISAKKR